MADDKDNKNNDDSKKVVLDYTIKELGKILESVRGGQMPALTKSLKKLTDIVNIAEKKVKENKVDDKELDAIFDKIAKDIKEDKK